MMYKGVQPPVSVIQMGQTERNRRKLERLEFDRKHLAKLALVEAKRLYHTETPEDFNIIGHDVKWGEKMCACLYVPLSQVLANPKYSSHTLPPISLLNPSHHAKVPLARGYM